MQFFVNITPFNLVDLCFQVWKTGSINQAHRQQLRSALLAESLSEYDQIIINRMLYAVRRGWLKVVS